MLSFGIPVQRPGFLRRLARISPGVTGNLIDFKCFLAGSSGGETVPSTGLAERCLGLAVPVPRLGYLIKIRIESQSENKFLIIKLARML